MNGDRGLIKDRMVKFESEAFNKLYRSLRRELSTEELVEVPKWFSEGEPNYHSAILWIVDIDTGSRELIRTKLESVGFSHVKTFSNFQDFWLALQRRINEGDELPDILIMSSNLGLINTIEIARALKATPATKDISVIIVTSRIASSYRADAFEAGVDDVMLKPVNTKELTARIKMLLRNKYVGLLEKRLLFERMKQEKERKLKEAYREVIAAVTSGKLIIADRRELEDMLRDWELIRSWNLSEPKHITQLRETLREELRKLNMSEDRLTDFCVAVGEIATNAVKHANGGRASLFVLKESSSEVGVLIEDEGSGIDFSKLARSTLLPGYSTYKWSLGMGFTLALSLTDGITLTTDSSGTSVFLRKCLEEPSEEDLISEYLSKFEIEP